MSESINFTYNIAIPSTLVYILFTIDFWSYLDRGLIGFETRRPWEKFSVEN